MVVHAPPAGLPDGMQPALWRVMTHKHAVPAYRLLPVAASHKHLYTHEFEDTQHP